MAKRDFVNYDLKDGRKVVYRGITNDPDRRTAEHQQDGKRFTHMSIQGPKVSRDTALKREQESLATYRQNHGGMNPKYNQTDNG